MELKNINYNKKPLISVITPCYNLEKYIEKSINSVLSQSFTNFEYILINDGSKDKTLEILKKYLRIDNRIRVIDKVNEGVSKARNEGIKYAQGEYLYFLDGDDAIEQDFFKTIKEIIDSKEYDSIVFPYFIEKNQKKYLEKGSFKEGNYSKDILLKEILSRNICKRNIVGTSVLKRRIVMGNKILFNEELTYAEDHNFFLKCFLETEKNYYCEKPFFHYTIRNGSAINSRITLKRLDTLKALIELKSIFEREKIKNYFNFFMLITFIGNVNVLAKEENEKVIMEYLSELKKYEKYLDKIEDIKTIQYFLYKIIYLIYKVSPALCLKLLRILKKLRD